MPVESMRPQDHVVVWNGIPITGFAPGTFIEWARNTESYRLVVGSDGTGARAASADRSGTVTVTLKQTSPVNGALSAAAVLDERTGDGVGTLSVKDLSGLDVIAAASAWIRKPPDGEISNEITSRQWVFETDNLEILLGGNPI